MMVDNNVISLLDPFYSASIHLRKHNYEKCIDCCTTILSKNPYDQVRIKCNFGMKMIYLIVVYIKLHYSFPIVINTRTTFRYFQR